MNVLVVSGLWPPDVGGPASHAPEVCEYLLDHGHSVTAVTTAERPPSAQRYRVRWTSRRMPLGVRHVLGLSRVASLAARVDVVYSTGMYGRSGLGSALARTPLVVKLTSDPVFERSLRWGLAPPDLGAFQLTGGARIGALRRVRDLSLGHASRVLVPSRFFREIALAWGLPPEKVEVLPNPVSPPAGLARREELRLRHGLEGPTLVYAGRLVPQKALEVALEAVRLSDGVSLVVAGDGADRRRLEERTRTLGLDGRVRFLGAQPRRSVFELLKAADAAVLSSNWENFPHMAIEALAVGTPVVATDVGGVGEILREGSNGLLVPPGEPEALASAIERVMEDDALRARLSTGATGSVAAFAPEAVYGRLLEILSEAAGTA